MGFSRNPSKDQLLKTNPHPQAMEARQQTVVVSTTPSQTHSSSVKRQAWDENEVRPLLSGRSAHTRLQNSKAALHKFRGGFDEMQAETGCGDARQDNLFGRRPGREEVRLGRQGIEGANRPRLKPWGPALEDREDFPGGGKSVLRMQRCQKAPGFCTQALLLLSNHGGWS